MPSELRDGAALAGDGRMHVLAAAREIPGALPQADILEHRAVLRGPVVDRRLADGIEQIAARGSRRTVPKVVGV